MSDGPVDQQLIVQISDPHIGYASEVRDPEPALAAAVRYVLTIEPVPLAVILSGDLTNSGSAEQYRTLRELIAPLPMPVHPLVGNHDDRDGLREAFADHRQVAATDGFVQYSVECGPVRLIVCDSREAGTDAGALGAERLGWIERELAAAGGAPAILAIHHPPIQTGLRGFDGIGLPEADRRELERIVAAADGLERIVSGHIHRAILGEFGGVPAFVCPSVHLQAELDLSLEGRLRLIGEPPALAVHVLRPGEPPISHIQPIPQG